MHHGKTRAYAILTMIGLFALTGCAPEGTAPTDTLQPGEVGITDSETVQPGGVREQHPDEKSSGDVATDTPQDLGNIEGRVPVEGEKTATLPDSFPLGDVPLPQDIRIDNAGERADGSWFVVVRSTSMDAAGAEMDALAAEGQFSVDEIQPLSATGFQRTLTRDAITVEALGYLDGDVPFVSLDITVDP